MPCYCEAHGACSCALSHTVGPHGAFVPSTQCACVTGSHFPSCLRQFVTLVHQAIKEEILPPGGKGILVTLPPPSGSAPPSKEATPAPAQGTPAPQGEAAGAAAAAAAGEGGQGTQNGEGQQQQQDKVLLWRKEPVVSVQEGPPTHAASAIGASVLHGTQPPASAPCALASQLALYSPFSAVGELLR